MEKERLQELEEPGVSVTDGGQMGVLDSFDREW